MNIIKKPHRSLELLIIFSISRKFREKILQKYNLIIILLIILRPKKITVKMLKDG